MSCKISSFKAGNDIPFTFSIYENGELKNMSSCPITAWTISGNATARLGGMYVEYVSGTNPYQIVVHNTSNATYGEYFLGIQFLDSGQKRSYDKVAFVLAPHSDPYAKIASQPETLNINIEIANYVAYGAVLYNTPQNLTTEEQLQARANINAQIAGDYATEAQGLPDGGTEGQYLRKNSSTPYDSAWADLDIPQNVVTYTPQTLTDSEKLQARTNIGAGTSSFSGVYGDLTSKPSINNVTLDGNKTSADLSLQPAGDYATNTALTDGLDGKVDKIAGKGLSANDYTDADQTLVESAIQSSDVEPVEYPQVVYATEAYVDAKTLPISSNAILLVAIAQTTATNIVYTFDTANFNAVNAIALSGQPVSVKIIDNRSTTYKTIDLSGIYQTKYNTTLSQIEISDPNVARGFYLNGGVASNRGCVTCDTAKYIDAGAIFNAISGYYECSALNDITEKQMGVIYYVGHLPSGYYFNSWCSRLQANPRMILPSLSALNSNTIDCANTFFLCSSVEVITFSVFARGVLASNLANTFRLCTMLHTILEVIDCTYITSSAGITYTFSQCTALANVTIKNLKVSISFSDSPAISVNTGVYLITNAIPTSAITITLHPTAYAIWIADAGIQSALSAQPLVTLVSA